MKIKRIHFYFALFLFSISFSIQAQNLDFKLLKNINDTYTPNGGKTMRFITNSDTYVSIGVPSVLLISSYLNKDKDLRWKSTEMLGAAIVNGVITAGLKWSIHRERPFVKYPNDIHKYSVAGSYSFPSGHTSMAFTFATSMTLAFPHWYIAVPCFAYASCVAYSRMYLGVHYPSDVLAGSLIGAASSVGTHYARKWLQGKMEKRKSMELGLYWSNVLIA